MTTVVVITIWILKIMCRQTTFKTPKKYYELTKNSNES